MKKFAAFSLALFLLFSLSLTAFAYFGPDGFPGGPYGDEPTNRSDLRRDGQEISDDAQNVTESGDQTEFQETVTEENVTEQASEESRPSTEEETDKALSTESNQLNPSGGNEEKPQPPQTATQDDAVNYTVIIVVIICGVVLLALLITIAVLLLKKKQPEADDADDAAGRGIPVRIEVLSGACYNPTLSFRLRRNLTIGSDHGCDLVFDDAQMQPMHAVISADADMITLEECCDAGCTYLGGMKIFAPNRLRSGDLITIGNTSFRIFLDV